MIYSYDDLGLIAFFTSQVPAGTAFTPYRIAEVHRDRLSALSPDGTALLTTPPPLKTGDLAVGDWVLANAAGQVHQVLQRQSLVHRRAPGTDARLQLIAANINVLFITSSCNADFNPARLERYLAVAYAAPCLPVIVLTKADLSPEVENFVQQAQQIDTNVPVLAVNALDPGDLAKLAKFCGPGQTAALVGSSGVGKTTLTNGLSGRQDATGAAREDDAKGRHITTNRALRPMLNGGWLIDTPGMRALRLEQASDGIDTLFDDISKLAETCRFADCSHMVEPGCAVLAAVHAGKISPERKTRWDKLSSEDVRNTETLAQTRARNRTLTKHIKSVSKGAHWQKKR